MAQRMQLQNSGSASGVALAVSDPACSLVDAGTSCCLVYNYDVRRYLNQWLSEIPSVFSEADWWVIQLTPRVFFTVFQSRKFCDRPSCPTLCNWSQWNLPQGLAYSAMLVFTPVEPLDSGMTTWSDVLVSSHACMLKKFLWDCAVLVQRHFTECSQSLRNQCHRGGKRKRSNEDHVSSWTNIADSWVRPFNQVRRVLQAPCLWGVFSWSAFVNDM